MTQSANGNFTSPYCNKMTFPHPLPDEHNRAGRSKTAVTEHCWPEWLFYRVRWTGYSVLNLVGGIECMNGIGAVIRIGREIRCLPYAGFF